MRDSGPIVLTTSAAEFQMLPSGVFAGNSIERWQALDFSTSQMPRPRTAIPLCTRERLCNSFQILRIRKFSTQTGKLGRGKRVEIAAHASAAGTAIERTTAIETYDDFPNIALVSIAYKNTGTTDFKIDQAVVQQHRFNAKQADTKRSTLRHVGISGIELRLGQG